MKVTRTLQFVFAALVAGAGFASTGWAQSGASPTGETPLGFEEKKDAKGPALTGVISIELINSDGLQADSARIVVRLRRGSHLSTFFEELEGPVFFNTDDEKEVFQAEVLGAFRDAVLAEFFDGDCGNTSPDCVLVLKQADEFGLTDDGFNQFAVMDVTVSLADATP